jgi:hypothetical protein
MESIDFPCAGGTTTLIDTTHGTLLTQDNRATRQSFIVLGVTNQDAGNVSDGISELHITL